MLAELGSLSLEFTRLAQITKEPKYYDAVARVTDALEEFQNRTRLPGLWPSDLDASGCQKPKLNLPDNIPAAALAGLPGSNGRPMVPGQKNGQLPASDFYPASKGTEEPRRDEVTDVKENSDASPHLDKRQLEQPVAQEPISQESLCIPQGLDSYSDTASEQYTIGGKADSTYEYLPKMWLLLGGREDKYKSMYEAAIEVVKDKLLFRPMVSGGDDILFAGSYDTGYPARAGIEPTPKLDPEGAHLTCFAGGMFALGAKIFEREEDLDIAAKLTEGCIWAYNATSSGVMPEQFFMVPCDDRKSCEWNETKWWDVLDPFQASRQNAYKEQMAYYEQRVKQAVIDMGARASAGGGEVDSAAATASAQPTASPASQDDDLVTKKQKRQLDGTWNPEEDPPTPVAPFPDPPLAAASASMEAIYKPEPPVTQEEYVKSRILDERLPKGFVQIPSRKYILRQAPSPTASFHFPPPHLTPKANPLPHHRPEAIESVFYMYRITGSPHWREAGWRMFRAIQKVTRTEFGNSAIDDVTKAHPEQADIMESFWLAETLKYFWLLFADEEAVGLDEWVLNTEAHPFRRPTS